MTWRRATYTTCDDVRRDDVRLEYITHLARVDLRAAEGVRVEQRRWMAVHLHVVSDEPLDRLAGAHLHTREDVLGHRDGHECEQKLDAAEEASAIVLERWRHRVDAVEELDQRRSPRRRHRGGHGRSRRDVERAVRHLVGGEFGACARRDEERLLALEQDGSCAPDENCDGFRGRRWYTIHSSRRNGRHLREAPQTFRIEPSPCRSRGRTAGARRLRRPA